MQRAAQHRLSEAAERNLVTMLTRAMRAKRTLYGRVVSDTRTFFEAVDRDGSGTISLSELSDAFRRLDLDVSATDMDKVLACIDIDGGGNLDYSELRRWLIRRDNVSSEQDTFYAGCTIRIDGLEGELSETHALVEAFSHFGEIVACDVVIPQPHDDDRIPWALVTFELSQAAELAKLFSADLPPVESLSAGALASATSHLPGGCLQLEGLMKRLAKDSWLHIRGLNRKEATHTEGRLSEIVREHEMHLHRDAEEKVMADLHERHVDPTHVPAYTVLRTGSRGYAKGTMLDHRPPYAAFPQEARERETRRLKQRIREREETIQLLQEWGQGKPAEVQAEIEAKQEASAADLLMIQKMAESAKGDEQAVWTMAMSKVRSMAREQRQVKYCGSELSSCNSATAPSAAGDSNSVNSKQSEFSISRMQAQREKARRIKIRKQKKAELEAKRLAADMNLNIARGKTPSSQRTVHVSEKEDKELQRKVKLLEAKRLQKQKSTLAAPTTDDSDDDSQSEPLHLPSLGPERVLPQVLDKWTSRLPSARVANMPPVHPQPLTPGTQKRLRFLDSQRAKQAKKVRALDGAGVSPRVVALHKRIDDAKNALAAKDYAGAAVLVDEAIAKYPKLQSLYVLRARIDSQASQHAGGSFNPSKHGLLSSALQNAEVAVAITPTADAHRMRAESQRMLGNGHAVGALKSTDAALLIEPGDARQSREFRKRLAEVKRDRTFRGNTPKDRSRQVYPTPSETTAVQPIPPSWPEPPREPPRVVDGAPMASQRNHWDAIGLVDLMKPQDRLRAVILYALRPRSRGYVPGASPEEQEDYMQILKELEKNRAACLATVEDDLDFLRVSLRRAGIEEENVTAVLAWVRSGDGIKATTDHVVGILKACCPIATHEDWKAVLQLLHSHKLLLRELFISLASRSASRGHKTSAPATVDHDVWLTFVFKTGALRHQAPDSKQEDQREEEEELAEQDPKQEHRQEEEEEREEQEEQEVASQEQENVSRHERRQQQQKNRSNKKHHLQRKESQMLEQQRSAERIYLRAMQDNRDGSILLEALKDDYSLTASRPPRTPGYTTRSLKRGVAEATMSTGEGLRLGCFCAALLRLARESFAASKRRGLAEQLGALLQLIAEQNSLISAHHVTQHQKTSNADHDVAGHVENNATNGEHDNLRRPQPVDAKECQQLPSIRTVFDKFRSQLRRIFNAACAELPSAPLAAAVSTVPEQGLQLEGWLELARKVGLLTADNVSTGGAGNTITRASAEVIFREESEEEGSSLLIRVLGFQGFEAALIRWALMIDPLERNFVDQPGTLMTLSMLPASDAVIGNDTDHVACKGDEAKLEIDLEPEPGSEAALEPRHPQPSSDSERPAVPSAGYARNSLVSANTDCSQLDVESFSAWLELCIQKLLQGQ